jgi:hypothetical protein
LNDRPDKYPDWALEDITEPVVADDGKIVQQANVYEPPQVKKNYGILNNTTMGRQWFNWLFRYVDNWIKYLDDPAPSMVSELPDPKNFPLGKEIFITDIKVQGFNGVKVYNDGERWRFLHNCKEVKSGK